MGRANHRNSIVSGGLFALVGLPLLFAPVKASWLVLAPPDSTGISAMSFVSPDTGFIATWGSSERPTRLWKTLNGGLAFSDVTPAGFRHWDRATRIQSLDHSNIYVLAHRSQGGDSTMLYRTSDGGGTWQRLLAVRAWSNSDNPTRELRFFDAQRGYVFTENQDTLFRTSDGGANWTRVTLPGRPRWEKKVSVVDTLAAFVAYGDTAYTTLSQTTNGGETWDVLYQWGDTVYVSALQFRDRQTGFVAYQMYRSDPENCREKGAVARTSDAGRTWAEVYTSGWREYAPEVDDLCAVGDTEAFVTVVGFGAGSDQCRLYKTRDGRSSFRVPLPMRVDDLGPVCFARGTSVGYVAFNDLSGTSGLLKTVDGGGESLDFWRPLTTIPVKPKRGTLLASVPDSNALYLLDKATQQLRTYGLGTGVWQEKKPIPIPVKDGSMVYDGVGLVVSRARSKEFWSYAPDFDTWARLPDIPGETKMKPGSCITSDNGDPLFALKGGKTCEFWSFDRDANQWLRKQDIPGTPVTKGACLACDNDYVYALKGGKGNEFWAFSIEGDTWFRLPDVVGMGIKEGSCLSANNIVPGNSIACLKGGTNECWYYTLDGYWKLAPGIPGRKKVKKGAQLTFDDAGTFYAIRDARSPDIWQTENLSMLFSEPQAWNPSEGNQQSAAIQAVEPNVSVRAISSAGRVSIATGGANWSSVSLLDVSGRVVATVHPGHATAGTLEIGDHLAPGIYVVRIQTPTRTFIRKVILAR